MNRWHCASLALAMTVLVWPQGGYAGTLEIGKPTVEGGRYTLPVVLSGGDDRVAALDFRLRYDPAVFQPVSTTTGIAARQTSKVVTANMAAPGEYIVVIMGPNQNTLDRGEVARIVMERVGNAPAGRSQLTIAEPTLATSEGVELPAQGMTWTLEFGEPDESAEEERASDSDDTARDARRDETDAGDATEAAPGNGRFMTAVVKEMLKGGAKRTSPAGQLETGAPASESGGKPAAPQARSTPREAPVAPQAPGRTEKAAAGGTAQRDDDNALPKAEAGTMAQARPKRAGTKFESETNQVASPPPPNAAGTEAAPPPGFPWASAGLIAVPVLVIAAGWWWRRKRTG